MKGLLQNQLKFCSENQPTSNLYLYLAQNKLPSTKSAIQKMETLAEKYSLLDSLLFKLVTTPKKETVLLAIPETYANKIITLQHSSLFAGHQGVIKTYLTIGDKFVMPGLTHYLRSHKRVSYLSIVQK